MAVIDRVIVDVLVNVSDRVIVGDQSWSGVPPQPACRLADTAGMLSFQKLDVYRCSIDFLVFSRRLRLAAARGNADLVDQLRRSAQSIPQNIAEGVGKVSRADKARYFGMARGSAMESASHLDVMQAEELIDEERYVAGITLLERIVAMLTRLIDP